MRGRRLILVLVFLVVAGAPACRSAADAAADAAAGEGATVVRIVDGDTVVVDVAGREEPVRLIGIDTPESTDPRQPPECFGTEASARASELLPPGTEVRLERDVEARDRYQRLLAYVFRRPDDLFVNLALVEEGYAAILTIGPNTAYADRLAAAARSARGDGRGLWTACRPP